MTARRIEEVLNEDSGVWFSGTLIERRQTSFQLIEVYDTPELGRMFRLDGYNMTSERDEFFYHENLVHPALIAHPNPRHALIIGGGDGGSAEEILKHSTIERCDMVELDGDVIEVAKQYFAKVHRGVFDNPRLGLTIGDGLAWLKKPPCRYDLIALDLTDPVGPSSALYTPEFFADCRAALTENGAMVMHIGSPVAHPKRVRESVDYLSRIFATVSPYFVHIPLYGSTWGFAVASASLDATRVSAAEVEARLAARGVGERQYYNGAVHQALFTQPEYVKALLR
ncbi:MAG: polyamine aminopropyltransferase [Betaproteobacteria bacterium]|nr:polyamine aminopropyltransferase [Betaproteobacteria bacterium]